MGRIENKLVNTFDELYYYMKVPRRRAKWAKAMYEKVVKSGQIQPIPKIVKEKIDERWHNLKLDYRWFDVYHTFCKMYRKDCNDDISMFVPLDFFFCQCEPFFNNPLDGLSYSDKNMNNLHFSDIKQPKTFIRYINGLFFDSEYRLITRDESKQYIQHAGTGIIKPATDSGGGHGIIFFDSSSDFDFETVFCGRKNIIVQECFHQHSSLSKLHEKSVNTLRILSLVWQNQVYILSAVIRIGMNNNRVDNLSAGGLYCGINNDGVLSPYACVNYSLDEIYTKHPNSGITFGNYRILNYDKVLDVIKLAAPKFSRIGKMIAWDFSIDENGDPVMIETNLCGVANFYFQMANGPIFGDLTDQIIEAVKTNPRKTFGIK